MLACFVLRNISTKTDHCWLSQVYNESRKNKDLIALVIGKVGLYNNFCNNNQPLRGPIC